jgi:hypothetical protein
MSALLKPEAGGPGSTVSASASTAAVVSAGVHSPHEDIQDRCTASSPRSIIRDSSLDVETVFSEGQPSFADRPVLFPVDKDVSLSSKKFHEHVQMHGVEELFGGMARLYNGSVIFIPTAAPGVASIVSGAMAEVTARSKGIWNGDLESLASKATITQALIEVIVDIKTFFFGPKKNLFYSYPPTGFVIVGHPCYAGYILSVELMGRIHVALASMPFILGSDVHKSEVNKISDRARSLYHGGSRDLPDNIIWKPVAADQHYAGHCDKVAWCKYEGRFFKRVRSSLYEPAIFRRMAVIYTELERMWQDHMKPPACATSASPSAAPSSRTSQAPPGLVLDCKLWYGSHEVLVDMTFVEESSELCPDIAFNMLTKPQGNSDDADIEMRAVAKSVAAVVAWLAARRIIYVDIRGPNILVKEKKQRERIWKGTDNDNDHEEKHEDMKSEKEYYLIDYDDCHYADQPITSARQYLAFLWRLRENDRRPWLAMNVILAHRNSVFMDALNTAFEEQRRLGGCKRSRESE